MEDVGFSIGYTIGSIFSYVVWTGIWIFIILFGGFCFAGWYSKSKELTADAVMEVFGVCIGIAGALAPIVAFIRWIIFG